MYYVGNSSTFEEEISYYYKNCLIISYHIIIWWEFRTFTSTLGCGACISCMRLCSKRALADFLVNQDFGIWLVLGVLEAPKTNYFDA